MKPFLAILFALFIVPSFAQSQSSDWHKLKIDNYTIAYRCDGEGSPTLVLEPPSGISAEDAFTPILAQLRSKTKVCMYERLGFGQSDAPPPGLRQTARDYSRELELVLKSAAPNDRFVVVGYSFGGFVARCFADSNPRRVAGLILIDSAQEDWISDMKVQMQPTDWEKMRGLLNWFERTYGHDVWNSQAEVRATALRRDLPVRIISRGLQYQRIRQANLTDGGVDIYNALHDKHQFDLLKITDRTSRVVAAKSEHLIVNSEPEIVLQQVNAILSEINR